MQQTLVRYQKGVGPKLAKVLSRIGVDTIDDLMHYFPRQYQDRTDPVKISRLEPGKDALIRASIIKASASRTKRNFSIFKAQVKDDSGVIPAVWFNQPFLSRVLKPGTQLFMFGKIEQDDYSGKTVFVPRDYDVITASGINDPIVPIYPLTEGLSQKVLRRIIRSALDLNIENVIDPLPDSIKRKFKLSDLRSSILDLHFPPQMSKVPSARRRLAFDELLNFQLGLIYSRKKIDENPGISFNVKGELTEKFLASMPFSFTAAQNRVLNEILSDMGSSRMMNRLLQGDVGCGKTVVALFAMIVAVQSGYQAAIMAPTEILAEQHYRKIAGFVKDLGIRVMLLTGSSKIPLKELNSPEPYIIVGTHALIEEPVKYGRLGLVVIDEQHRFGVDQRMKLRQKGENIDLIVMTATPIPRTLALTLYGDLDRSVIDEMPPGRTKIITRYVKEPERLKLNDFIKTQVAAGRQVYVVCPLVEESEKLDLKAAQEEVKALQNIFPEMKIGLVHGRMRPQDKDEVMSRFIDGTINMLVSTTVIEVGIDVPNATIMVIEHCERFGLSQLHQLRGRIGRGCDQSYCFLIGEPRNDASRARIEAMLKTTDGFRIAEADLKLRGPGEFFGVQQSGLPNFRVADIINDEDVIKEAREAAQILLHEGADLRDLNIKFWGKNLE